MNHNIWNLLRPVSFQESSGRIQITAILFHLGEDMQILLLGGKPHLGAITTVSPYEEWEYQQKGHMDLLPAREMARRISKSLNLRVGISCGIHFDGISREEIEECLGLCRRLTCRIINYVSDCKGRSDA